MKRSALAKKRFFIRSQIMIMSRENADMEDLQRNRLTQVIASAKKTGRYWKQDMIRRHKNVCVYGLGKFFADVFEDRNFKETFHVNCLADADSGKWGKKYCGIECIAPSELKDIEDLAVIIMLGNTLDVEQKFIRGGEDICFSI